MTNPEGHYSLTLADMKAYQLMLDSCFDLDIRSSGEKGMPTHLVWKVFAPAKDKPYYTAFGQSLAEAVENWFTHIKDRGTEPLFGT